ncbi:RelA/SpoT domain-containing protein [Streptomyces sp. NPDC057543]|uniref:RelA/SpoT domain-containing protein n=1 Tax=Streptomyces sp. NPDC057543 TaxID=3346163 RepID=UPI0036A1FF96
MAAKIPASFRTAYDDLAGELEAGKKYLVSRLQAELDDLNPVVIQVRVKDAGSIYAKLQKGESSQLLDLDDLIAARAVFLHPQQVSLAMDACQKTFPIIEERNTVAGKPDDFRYQQPHLIAGFPHDYVERKPTLGKVKVEIQFTTYIQHALQESTHDVIYKGERFSWREHRLDSRLRGLLEIVDEVLANLQDLAKVDEDPFYPIFDSRNLIIGAAQELWDAEELPADLRRFAITVEGLLKLSGFEVSDWLAVAQEHGDLIHAYSLTPVDKVIGVILRDRHEKFIQSLKKRRVLVSSELEGLVPQALNIPQQNRVSY